MATGAGMNLGDACQRVAGAAATCTVGAMAGKQPKHPRTYYFQFQEPPNERVRVEMFLLAYEDYASLQQTFPLPDLPIAYEGPISDHLYWVVNMHAALLRKFFSLSDQTEVHKVTEAVRSRITREDAQITHYLDEVEKFAPATSVPSRMIEKRGGTDVNTWERVLIELYGRHLHNDFGKWHASKRFLGRDNTLPMYEWCRGAIIVLNALVAAIQYGQQKGVLDIEDDYEPYFTQDGQLNKK